MRKKLGTKLYVVISLAHYCYPPSLPLSHLSRMTSLKKSKDGAQRRLRGLRAGLEPSGKEGQASWLGARSREAVAMYVS